MKAMLSLRTNLLLEAVVRATYREIETWLQDGGSKRELAKLLYKRFEGYEEGLRKQNEYLTKWIMDYERTRTTNILVVPHKEEVSHSDS